MTIQTKWTGDSFFFVLNCLVRSILLPAGVMQEFLVQAFSLFGLVHNLSVHCVLNPARLNHIGSINSCFSPI